MENNNIDELIEEVIISLFGLELVLSSISEKTIFSKIDLVRFVKSEIQDTLSFLDELYKKLDKKLDKKPSKKIKKIRKPILRKKRLKNEKKKTIKKITKR